MPFFASRHPTFDLRALEVGDSLDLADLHSADFARPWSEAEFESLLGQEAVFGFGAFAAIGRNGQRPVGFVLARRAADEAEILTIAVAQRYRRRGLGRSLMEAVMRRLHAERIAALFLEVDEGNQPAIALYRRLGFQKVGMRRDYYRTPDGKPSGAMVMRRDLV